MDAFKETFNMLMISGKYRDNYRTYVQWTLSESLTKVPYGIVSFEK